MTNIAKAAAGLLVTGAVLWGGLAPAEERIEPLLGDVKQLLYEKQHFQKFIAERLAAHPEEADSAQ